MQVRLDSQVPAFQCRGLTKCLKSTKKCKNQTGLIYEIPNYMLVVINSVQEKKEEIWISPVTKTPTPTEQSKNQRDNIKT